MAASHIYVLSRVQCTMVRVNNPSDAQRPKARRSSSRRNKGTRSVSEARRARAAKAGTTQAASAQQRFVDESHGKQSKMASATARVATEKAAPQGAWATRWALWKPHVKRFGIPLLINYGVTVGIIVACAVIIGIGAGFSRVPAAIGSLWMVLNLGSLNMTGAHLGFLPLAPAMLFVFAMSRRATKILGTSVSVRGLRVFILLSLLIPLLLTVIAWLMIWDASRVFDLAAPNLAAALISTLLVNGAAVVIGLRPRIWRALLLRRDLPTWPVEAFRLAGAFLKWMTLAGLLAAVVYALTNLSGLADTYSITSSLSGAIGLTLLALLYLPNMAIGGMAVLLGGEFHVGDGATSLFATTNINLPPLPIFAAIPHRPLPGGPFYLAITAVLAVVIVHRFVKSRGFIESPVAMAVGAGAAAALLGYCLAWLGGGELGVYGSAGALEWLFAAEAAAWLMLPALVFMVYASRAGSTVTEDIVEYEPAAASSAESQVETETEAETDADAESDVEAEAESDAKSDAEPEVDAESAEESAAEPVAENETQGDEAAAANETADQPEPETTPDNPTHPAQPEEPEIEEEASAEESEVASEEKKKNNEEGEEHA